MKNTLRSLGICCLLAACSKGGVFGVGDGGVAKVVGEYCGPNQVSSVSVYQTRHWRVVSYRSVTTYRDVAGTDGIVRRQEVRGCELVKDCVVWDGVALGLTAEQARARCG